MTLKLLFKESTMSKLQISKLRGYLFRITLSGIVITIFLLPLSHPDDDDEMLISFGPLAKVKLPLASEQQTPPASNEPITGLDHMPASLQGTTPDGQLQYDRNNNLIINADLRSLFDYFLSAYGEEELEQITARIRSYLRSNLPAIAVVEAEAILDAYLKLQRELTQVNGDQNKPPQTAQYLQQELQQRRAMRRYYLSPEVADAFYGAEEQYDQYTLNLMQLQKQPGSTEDKARQAAALLEQLPEAMQQSLHASQQILTLQEQTTALQLAEDTNRLQLTRQQLVGIDAAERLAHLDQQRAEWNDRIDSWLVLRDELAQNQQIDYSDRQQQIAQLRATYFQPPELVRVKAMERILSGEL
jgi:lipase chaperone LimK